MEQPSEVARAWWRELDPAERARLRRCRVPADALVLRETLALIRSLAWWQRPQQAAELAIVLAHVSEDDSRPLMRAMLAAPSVSPSKRTSPDRPG